jgi:hypothetical protein
VNQNTPEPIGSGVMISLAKTTGIGYNEPVKGKSK